MPPKPQTIDSRQDMKRTSFEVFRFRGAYPKETALHHHDFYEINFFLSGNIQYNIESRSYLLTPGDVLLISPMELHQPVLDEEQGGYERIVVWINRRFLDSLCMPGQDLAACFDTTAPGHTNMLSPDSLVRQLLTFQLDQLMQAAESEESYSEIYAMSYLVQALVLLNRQAKQMKHGEEVRVASSSVVYNILEYINEHYREELSLDFLANRFFISKYHLSREFGRLVGTSVHRYIVLKRLIMAKQMMSNGMSSSEVYQHCGFGDYSNFYRAFKTEYQMSPREFLDRVRESTDQNEDRNRRIREQLEHS